MEQSSNYLRHSRGVYQNRNSTIPQRTLSRPQGLPESTLQIRDSIYTHPPPLYTHHTNHSMMPGFYQAPQTSVIQPQYETGYYTTSCDNYDFATDEEYPDVFEECNPVMGAGKENTPPRFYTEEQYSKYAYTGDAEEAVQVYGKDQRIFNQVKQPMVQNRKLQKDVNKSYEVQTALKPSSSKFFDNSFEETSASTNKTTSKASQVSKTNGNFYMKREEKPVRILSGTVEKVIEWSKYSQLHSSFFEVVGILEKIRTGKFNTQKILLIRDKNTGPTLQVTYYEIDRPLPNFRPGTLVKCVGKLSFRNRLQVFKVNESSEDEKSAVHRISFFCNRVVQGFQDKK